MTKIPTSEVTFHPHSYGDPAGRVFTWNGALYRGIRREWTPFFKRLFEDSVIQRLVDEGLLIDTEVAPLSVEGFDMVVRHRSLPFASYPEEWCGTMLRDAAITILDLLEELARRGLTLKDGHPWNVLYDACRPIYVDLTSIALLDDRRWGGYDSFCRFCLYPLILMSEGQGRIARLLIPEYDGVLPSDLRVLTRRSRLSSSAGSLARRTASRLWRGLAGDYLDSARHRNENGVSSTESRRREAAADFARRLRHRVLGVALETNGPDGCRDTLSPSSSDYQAEIARVLHRVLTELCPASILEATSRESYSAVAASLVRNVVCFDTDQACVARLYHHSRENKLPTLPLVMDFTDPTPARGLAGHWTIGATERFQCDMVLALTLVQYGVVERRLRFEHIVDGLAQFSRRWLVVDFHIPDDGGVRHQAGDSAWYTLEGFIGALRQRFRYVTKLPALTGPRVLLLCEK